MSAAHECSQCSGPALQVVLKNDIEYLMKPWAPAVEEDADMRRLLTGMAEQTSAVCPICHVLHHCTAVHDLQVGSQQGPHTMLAPRSQQRTTLQRQLMATRRPWCDKFLATPGSQFFSTSVPAEPHALAHSLCWIWQCSSCNLSFWQSLRQEIASSVPFLVLNKVLFFKLLHTFVHLALRQTMSVVF